MNWNRVTDAAPPLFRNCFLYRVGDLYPVVGRRVDQTHWVLWEGGDEDDDRRKYPTIGGGDDWQPTHYADIDLNEIWSLRGD